MDNIDDVVQKTQINLTPKSSLKFVLLYMEQNWFHISHFNTSLLRLYI